MDWTYIAIDGQPAELCQEYLVSRILFGYSIVQILFWDGEKWSHSYRKARSVGGVYAYCAVPNPAERG